VSSVERMFGLDRKQNREITPARRNGSAGGGGRPLLTSWVMRYRTSMSWPRNHGQNSARLHGVCDMPRYRIEVPRINKEQIVLDFEQAV